MMSCGKLNLQILLHAFTISISFIFSTMPLSRAEMNSQPNIVVILADDLGWNDISLHGSPQIPTPNIDRLAQKGVILNHYYTMHLCSPTRGSLLTGRHAMQLGLQRFVITEMSPFGLGLNETIIPQYLKQYGYNTHAVGKWHQGFFAKELTPLYRGFDSFYGFLTSHESYYDHRCFDSAFAEPGGNEGYDFRDDMDVDFKANGSYSTYLYTRRAEKIIADHDKTKPLFLYMAEQAVHSGYGSGNSSRNELEAPQEIIDKFSYIKDEGRRRFAAMAYLLDESVGNITRALVDAGLMDNTIIIFSTDNGGPVAAMSMNHANNWPLRGSKASYWEGGVRGDGFVYSPLIRKPGRTFDGLMHITDWLPTILHVASNGSTLQTPELYGMNMWQSISEGEPSPRHQVIINWDYGTGAIINGTFKLQVLGNDPMVLARSGWYKPESIDVNKINFTVKCATRNPSLPECTKHTSPCLYDLAVDPCEYNNIAAQHPDIVAALYARLMEFANAAQPPRNCPCMPKANPVLHGGIWTPYIKLNDTHHDRMC